MVKIIICFVLFFAFVMGSSVFAAAETQTLKPGDKAPDFSDKDQNGKVVTLSRFFGKEIVVLYFYPKDFTSGCTAEACSFRDNYEAFMKKGAVVIGVSFDNDESHVKFTRSYKLPFSLLADPKGALSKMYGVSTAKGFADRVTFVIDKKGVIRFVYKSMKEATMHVENALKDLESM